MGVHALTDVGERTRAAGGYASAHGSPGGFPAFLDGDHEHGLHLGAHPLTAQAAQRRDAGLCHIDLREDQLGDVEAPFRAGRNCADEIAFVDGFPAMLHARRVVFDPFRGGRSRLRHGAATGRCSGPTSPRSATRPDQDSGS